MTQPLAFSINLSPQVHGAKCAHCGEVKKQMTAVESISDPRLTPICDKCVKALFPVTGAQ